MNSLGEYLQQNRKNRGITQEEAAIELGVSRQRLSNWERGLSEPGLDAVVKMAEVYGMTLSELLGNESGRDKKESTTEERSFWEENETELALVGMLFCMLTVLVYWFGFLYNLGILFFYPKKNLDKKLFLLLKAIAVIGIGNCLNNIVVWMI